MIPLDVALWGRRGPAALATRLRRELEDYEARLNEAAGVLEAARQEEQDATLALLGRELADDADARVLDAARKRLRYATRGRELAWLSCGIARVRVHLHAGVLRRLETPPEE